MDDLVSELAEISQLIASTAFISEVRRAVSKVKRDGFVVTDSDRAGVSGCDVVVKCDQVDKVARRIKSSLPESVVERVSDSMLRVSRSRRGSEVFKKMGG